MEHKTVESYAQLMVENYVLTKRVKELEEELNTMKETYIPEKLVRQVFSEPYGVEPTGLYIESKYTKGMIKWYTEHTVFPDVLADSEEVQSND